MWWSLGRRAGLKDGQRCRPSAEAQATSMSRFAIRTPYLIVVICLVITLVGIVSVVRMPVDLFPAMNIPVVAVATFYSGMPPEQIEGNITYHLERFFTLASGIDHMESRSLSGVSLIKVYFQPGTNPDSAVTTIASLAMAEISHLPPGTLPPFVLKMDASSLPVCLVTLQGEDLSETQLKDLAQNVVRNQLAGVAGAAVPQPFGGRWRQIMLYVDPFKLEARQLSLMDVVRAMNESNLILPAGDVQIGQYDYNIYANSQVSKVDDINQVPIKLSGENPVRVSDIGIAKDAYALQYNAVRVDGQRSVYLPVLKQGGDSNTIAVVDGVREKLKQLVRCSAVAGEPSGLRSIAIRQDRDPHAAGRRRHRTVPHLAHDSGLSRQHAGHALRSSSRFRFRRWRPSLRCKSAAARSTRWCWADWRWRSRA